MSFEERKGMTAEEEKGKTGCQKGNRGGIAGCGPYSGE